MAFINAAGAARNCAVVEATKTKRIGSWKHWHSYLNNVGITSIFLDGFSQLNKNIIMSGFAQAIRQGTFSSRNKTKLVEGSVTTALSHVAQTFRSNDRKDPRLDKDGKTCYYLQEQFRGYKNQDEGVKKQKALPLAVLRKMMELSSTEIQQNQTWLLIGAIFFAMRSCEYLRTATSENNKRTNILRLRNFKFKKNGRVLEHDSQGLLDADLVIITFEFQKNNVRNRTVHMFKTGDTLLCPVVAWVTTVQRILNTVPETSGDTKISSYYVDGTVRDTDSNIIRARLRGIVALIGEKVLGFTKEEVGLHSIRSGGAMAMFLSNVSEIIIQRVGRWESTAFLEYIREQVENFTHGVSRRMLENENFYHLSSLSDSTYSNNSTSEKNENPTCNEGGEPLCTPYTVRYNENIYKEI